MTRIWPFSDFQLTHRRAGDVPLYRTMDIPEADIAIVAGDMFPPLDRSLRLLATLADRMEVVYVPGNRDFYGSGTIASTLAEARKLAARLGIHLLYNDTVTLKGVRVVGGTGWTDYELQGDAKAAMKEAMVGLSDHAVIRDFTPADALAEHRRFAAHLEAELAIPFEGPTVVVTHHAPHARSTAPEYVGDPMTPSFVSDLSRFMDGGNAPALWIHGGVHRNYDYVAQGTRVICNSFGYPAENDRFHSGMVVEV